MKAKMIRNDDGTMEQVMVLEPSDNFRATEPALMTIEERRKILLELERSINRPRELAFEDFLRHGKEILTDEQRAQATGTDSAGGYLTPESFASTLEVALKVYDELFDVATLVETDKGGPFNYPIDDDTVAVATIVAENAVSITNSPVVFGGVHFDRCPQWRSGKIVASMELAQDSAFPLSTILANMFGRRFARGVGAYFIANLIAESDTGITSAATGAVTGDELLDLIASVDASYSQNGSFLMSIGTLIALKKLKATTSGDYLLPFSRDGVTGRSRLFGFPVYLSPSMPALGAGNKSVAFGDLSRFIRREVRNSLRMNTYHELFATSGQVGYEAFIRVDGHLAKSAASPLPIRLLACHS